MAAAVPIIKVVGVALSAKAAYDGLKEGNFFKAVVGAVGAYYGVSSLATPATAGGSVGVQGAADGAARTGLTAGANAADKAATAAVAKGLEEGAANVAADGLMVGAENMTRSAAQIAGAEAAGGAARSGFIDSLQVGGEQLAKRGGAGGAGGLLSRVNDGIARGANLIEDKAFSPIREAFGGANVGQGKGLLAWGKENPEVVSAGAKLLGGYMEGKAEEDLIKRQERLINERYDRMGSPVDVSGHGRLRFDPESRRFVQVTA